MIYIYIYTQTSVTELLPLRSGVCCPSPWLRPAVEPHGRNARWLPSSGHTQDSGSPTRLQSVISRLQRGGSTSRLTHMTQGLAVGQRHQLLALGASPQDHPQHGSLFSSQQGFPEKGQGRGRARRGSDSHFVT